MGHGQQRDLWVLKKEGQVAWHGSQYYCWDPSPLRPRSDKSHRLWMPRMVANPKSGKMARSEVQEALTVATQREERSLDPEAASLPEDW